MPPWLISAIAIVVVVLAIGASLVLAARRNRRDGRGGRTRDDAGRVVTLLDPVPMHALGRSDVIEADVLESIVQQITPGAPSRRWGLGVAIVVGVVVIGGIAAIVSIEGAPAWQDLVGTLTNPAIIACVLGGAVAPILIARQERLGRLRAIMLRHRRCPHCGYGLRGLPTDDDGLTTCPECASIWRIDEASCVDPGPVPASRPRGILALVALGVAALVAGLVMYFVIR